MKKRRKKRILKAMACVVAGLTVLGMAAGFLAAL